MRVSCSECGITYFDEACWTICPHLPLEFSPYPYDTFNNPQGYCREHDLAGRHPHQGGHVHSKLCEARGCGDVLESRPEVKPMFPEEAAPAGAPGEGAESTPPSPASPQGDGDGGGESAATPGSSESPAPGEASPAPDPEAAE